MKILLTGSSGRLGNTLRVALESEGYSVVRFDIRDKIEQDVRDKDAVSRALQGCDGVIHLAAVSQVGAAEANPTAAFSVNVRGTETLFDAIRVSGWNGWVINAGDCAVFGNRPNPKAYNESIQIVHHNPTNHLGWTKSKATEMASRCAKAIGTPCVTLHFSTIYGSLDDPRSSAIYQIVNAAIYGDAVQFSNPDDVSDYIHIEDAVEAVLCAVELMSTNPPKNPLEIEVCSGRSVSTKELVKLAGTAIARPVQAVWSGRAERSTPNTFYGHPSRAKEILGFEATADLKWGILTLYKKVKDFDYGACARVAP